jgi:hypothetical protein
MLILHWLKENITWPDRVSGPPLLSSSWGSSQRFSFHLTAEDRLTRSKWMRRMAAFYGCMALLVFGLIMLTKPSSVVPKEARDRQTWSARLQGERLNRNADVSGNTR